jgi:hypothetical protein
VDSGGFTGIEDGGAGTFPVPKAVAGWIDGGGGVDGSGGTALDEGAAAGAGPRGGTTGITGDGGCVILLGVLTGEGGGEAAARRAVDVIAERRAATPAAGVVALGGVFLAAITRFRLTFSALAFVVRCTVDLVAGFGAFVVRATGRFAAAALPVSFLALVGCSVVRFAAVALLVFLFAGATRLAGRLAFVARTSFLALAADRAPADFNFAGLAGRLAFVTRPDDFESLLFLETARAIELSPSSAASDGHDDDHECCDHDDATRRGGRRGRRR